MQSVLRLSETMCLNVAPSFAGPWRFWPYLILYQTYNLCNFKLFSLHCQCRRTRKYFLFFARQHPVCQGLLIHEVPRSHNDTPQSVGLLWTSDQFVAETSTWQHTTLTTDIHAPGGIRTHDLSRAAAVDLRLRPRGHWDRQSSAYTYV